MSGELRVVTVTTGIGDGARLLMLRTIDTLTKYLCSYVTRALVGGARVLQYITCIDYIYMYRELYKHWNPLVSRALVSVFQMSSMRMT